LIHFYKRKKITGNNLGENVIQSWWQKISKIKELLI